MHWIVVASQKEARIFTQTSGPKKLELLQTLANPLGQLRSRSLVRKEAGRGVKTSGRTGAAHYSEKRHEDLKSLAADQFAKEISRFLRREKLKRKFDSLTVAAEAHLMGRLKSEMDPHLQDAVTKWIKKDLQKTPKRELVRVLLPRMKSADQG